MNGPLRPVSPSRATSPTPLLDWRIHREAAREIPWAVLRRPDAPQAQQDRAHVTLARLTTEIGLAQDARQALDEALRLADASPPQLAATPEAVVAWTVARLQATGWSSGMPADFARVLAAQAAVDLRAAAEVRRALGGAA